MTLPASGAISFNDINVELGVSGTTQASLGQSSYRTLAGVASGAISMSNFWGKSNRVSVSATFASTTANAALNLSGLSGYVAGKTDITVTVNSGVYLYGTTAGGYGLNITGGTTGDTLTIVNTGFIIGYGGKGARGAAATAGSTALNIPINATIDNTNASAYIAGGGGGGGGTYYPVGCCETSSGGGGAGGGLGGTTAGGGPGAAGANGSSTVYGGGGGRILPGAASSTSGYTGWGGQAGGRGGNNFPGGGAGGGANNPGASVGGYSSGGGGGWGASGGSGGGSYTAGGAGGKAVNLNGKSVTWVSGNTTRVYGAVS